MSSVRDAWAGLWKRGWSLVPIEPKGKKARVGWLPYQKRRATPEELREWLQEWPDANPGVITGRISGVVVLDIDGPEGIAAVAALGDLPITPRVKTAKGYHFFFAYPDIPAEMRVVTKAGIAQNVDIRGDGGYVVAAGAVHESGVTYAWEVSPDETPLADLPSWLSALVVVSTPDPLARVYAEEVPQGDSARARSYMLGALAGEARRVADSPDGTKHDTLLSAASRLGGFIPTLSAQEIEQALYDAVASRAKNKRAALKTIRDGIDFGVSHPRQLPEDTPYIPREEPPISAYTEAESGEYTGPVGEQGATQPQTNIWTPVPITELPELDEEPPWLLAGYIAPRMVTLLTGTWKSGKSTLLTYIYKALEGLDHEFAGLPVSQAKILVVSEESVRHWRERQQNLELGGYIHLICKPFTYNPTHRIWETFLKHVSGEVAKSQYNLVVFDSLQNLWSVTDENDAAQVKGAVMGLNAISEGGAAVVLVAHPSKADQGEGKATRGSGVLPGMVDIIIEMRRKDATDRNDTRRVLTAYSRFDETPQELVVEYRAGIGYEGQGTRQDVERREREATIMLLLPTEAPGVTVAEMMEEWPTNRDKPRKTDVRNDLEFMVRTGIEVIKKDDRYYHALTNPQWQRKGGDEE